MMSRFVESDLPDIVARDPLIVSKNYKDSWEERKQSGIPLLPLFTLFKQLLLPKSIVPPIFLPIPIDHQ